MHEIETPQPILPQQGVVKSKVGHVRLHVTSPVLPLDSSRPQRQHTAEVEQIWFIFFPVNFSKIEGHLNGVMEPQQCVDP